MKIENSGRTFKALPDGPHDKLKIVTLTSNDPQHYYLIDELSANFDLLSCIIEKGSDQQKKLWKKRRYIDWFARLWNVQRQKYSGRLRYRRQYFNNLLLKDRPWKERIHFVNDVNDPHTITLLSSMKANVIVVCGTTYLAPAVIASSELAINIHGGVLPYYKGNHCIFFAYSKNDFNNIGASLHLVAEMLDAGDLIEVVRPPIYPHDNDEHLYCRSVHWAIDRLRDLLLALESTRSVIECKTQPQVGYTYRHRDRTPIIDVRQFLSRSFGRKRIPHIHRVLPSKE